MLLLPSAASGQDGDDVSNAGSYHSDVFPAFSREGTRYGNGEGGTLVGQGDDAIQDTNFVDDFGVQARPRLRHQDSFPHSDICHTDVRMTDFPIRHTRSQETVGKRGAKLDTVISSGKSRQREDIQSGLVPVPTLVSCDECLPIPGSRRITTKTLKPTPLHCLCIGDRKSVV